MTDFHWTFKVPERGWLANYRWHTTKPSSELGIKENYWKKSVFRQGWQNITIEIEGIEEAKKCLQALRNGVITAFGGRFRGASYDKNAELIVKQAKRSLKEAIKEWEKTKSIGVIEKVAEIPGSYYNWKLITGIFVGLITLIIVVALWAYFRKRTKKVCN